MPRTRKRQSRRSCTITFDGKTIDEMMESQPLSTREAVRLKKRESKNFYARKYWREIRESVISRDNGVCQYCGCQDAIQADHIVPRGWGGSDDLSNLVCCCMSCNKTAGGMRFRSFAGKREYILRERGI